MRRCRTPSPQKEAKAREHPWDCNAIELSPPPCCVVRGLRGVRNLEPTADILLAEADGAGLRPDCPHELMLPRHPRQPTGSRYS